MYRWVQVAPVARCRGGAGGTVMPSLRAESGLSVTDELSGPTGAVVTLSIERHWRQCGQSLLQMVTSAQQSILATEGVLLRFAS